MFRCKKHRWTLCCTRNHNRLRRNCYKWRCFVCHKDFRKVFLRKKNFFFSNRFNLRLLSCINNRSLLQLCLLMIGDGSLQQIVSPPWFGYIGKACFQNTLHSLLIFTRKERKLIWRRNFWIFLIYVCVLAQCFL